MIKIKVLKHIKEYLKYKFKGHRKYKNYSNYKNKINIKIGSILEIIYNNYTEKVMIITDFSGNTKFPYRILDLSTKDILMEFESINEIKTKLNIIKEVCTFDELFNL